MNRKKKRKKKIGSNCSFDNNNVSPILDIIGENDIDELVENNADCNKLIGKSCWFLEKILTLQQLQHVK